MGPRHGAVGVGDQGMVPWIETFAAEQGRPCRYSVVGHEGQGPLGWEREVGLESPGP